MHSILQLDNQHESIPPKEQTIGSFVGFQARIQSKLQKSKPYYFLTLPTAPYKFEVHEMMLTLQILLKKENALSTVSWRPASLSINCSTTE